MKARVFAGDELAACKRIHGMTALGGYAEFCPATPMHRGGRRPLGWSDSGCVTPGVSKIGTWRATASSCCPPVRLRGPRSALHPRNRSRRSKSLIRRLPVNGSVGMPRRSRGRALICRGQRNAKRTAPWRPRSREVFRPSQSAFTDGVQGYHHAAGHRSTAAARLIENVGDAGVSAGLVAMEPKVYVFALTFAIVGMSWLAHHANSVTLTG